MNAASSRLQFRLSGTLGELNLKGKEEEEEQQQQGAIGNNVSFHFISLTSRVYTRTTHCLSLVSLSILS